jgi:DNA polymerase-3 subunit delta
MVNLFNQPVVLLAGTEQFLKEEALARIKSAFLDEDSKDLNFNVFYAGTTSVEKVLECAATAPFLGRKRIVLVRQFERFCASDKEIILSYLRAPYRFTCLILETSENNLDQERFSEVSKYARVIFCNPIKEGRLSDWINACVAAKKKRIEEQAKTVLVSNLGNELQLLSNSLENLMLYIGEKETIAVSDVEKLTGPDVSASAFKLFDALIAGDKERCFQILDSLLKDGINSSQILGALAHKVISERNRLKASVRDEALSDLQKTDSDIKAGRQTQRIALELLMAGLLNLF